MLASGAHISIGGTDFYLEDSLPEHYSHAFADAQTFFSVQEAGSRVQHATLFHNNRYWFMTDWTQGEGSETWGTQVDSNSFDQGYANTRIPGRLRTMPIRIDTTTGFTTTIAAITGRLQFAAAGGYLWATAGNTKVWYSSNGTTWTSVIVTQGVEYIRWITGDGPYLYVVTSDTPLGKGKLHIYRVDNTPTSTTAVSDAAGTSAPDTFGLAHSAGFLYHWSGAKLRQYDVTDKTAFPITPGAVNVVFKTTDEDPTAYPLYGDMIALDSGVAFMNAFAGDTRIYAYKDGAGRQLWQMPTGFTGQKLAFTSGLLFVAGSYEGRAALFTLSLQTLQSTFVGYVRPWRSGALVAAAPGPGAQVLLLHSTEGVFVYDYIDDAISPLDYHTVAETNVDLSAMNPAGLATFAGNRYAILPLNSNDFEIVKWRHDLLNRTASGTGTVLYSPAWDFGFSMSAKTLLGLELTTLPLGPADSIKVDYKIEEDGVYTSFPSKPALGIWKNLGTMTGNPSTQLLPLQNQSDVEAALGGNDFSVIAGSSIVRDTAEGHFMQGTAGLAVTASNTTPNSGVTIGAASATTNVPAVTAGSAYVFSVGVKGNGLNNFFIRLRWLDAGGTFISNTDTGTLVSSLDFQVFSASGVAPAGAAFVRLETLFPAAGNTQALYMDEFLFELGTTPSVWPGGVPSSVRYFDLAAAGTSVKFRILRLRFTLVGKPELTNVAARVQMPPGQETFTLLVRLRDEQPGGEDPSARRPSNRQERAEVLRQKLWGFIRAKLPVTFLDGYAYRDKANAYDTYTVICEEPTEGIDTPAQGEMKLVLRRVDGNSLG